MNKGKTKLTVLYPNADGKHFNIDYYLNTHIPLVGSLLGDALKGGTVENGLGGGAPGAAAPFVAIGALYFDSVEEFQAAFGPNAAAIMADLPNFTNIEPVVQVV